MDGKVLMKKPEAESRTNLISTKKKFYGFYTLKHPITLTSNYVCVDLK